MSRRFPLYIVMCVLAVLITGCGNPIKRPPANVFPGSKEYEDRIATFKITPKQAYDIAHEEAVTDNKLQFLSRKPTVVVKRWYVFSMPQGSGASLQGYHVHGDTGEVRFHAEKRTVTGRN
ncbi:MAG: hypothetical protein LIQ30_11675 [Planctomycetes bacterium]|nr:hypothetical protein [Planctomycetota bacterium]MCD7896445.1 hypothetical protein [Planctomycetaceae bacterium]